jgi:hypothetical protein
VKLFLESSAFDEAKNNNTGSKHGHFSGMDCYFSHSFSLPEKYPIRKGKSRTS